MEPDATWFRDIWLYYCRHLHVWDTGYMMGPIIILTCGGDQWSGDDRVYVYPGMRRLWDRLMVEVTPDGAINPYGPNGGWNSTADYRIAMLERIAAKTGDGRYRFAAHKFFNYLRYQSREAGPSGYRLDDGSSWLIALAWLFADDSVEPARPDGGSLWTRRIEAARIPHADKALTERLLGNADPRENFGHICWSWYMTGKEWPGKLVPRRGWKPGDLFALVELHPTSFPANPGGIMGLNRWGAPFTQIVTSKGASVENRALIEDITGTAKRRYHSDKRRIDEFWHGGTMSDIRSEVAYFKETPQATYARIRVQNMDGLPVLYEREFVFAKNRFLATREIVTFEEGFPARVAPLWNTHNIGPQLGSHWANMFIHEPIGDNGTRGMKTPPVDLLVWFAPQADCRLQVVDRLLDDPRAEACPNQLRYVWEATPTPGQKLVFTQVYYPHPPYRSRATSNNPNPGAKAAYADELQATVHASGIEVIRDDAEVSILRLELEARHVEWVVFNPCERDIEMESGRIHAPYCYVNEKGQEQCVSR